MTLIIFLGVYGLVKVLTISRKNPCSGTHLNTSLYLFNQGNDNLAFRFLLATMEVTQDIYLAPKLLIRGVHLIIIFVYDR